jgi:lysophospholipase L1-like esterase
MRHRLLRLALLAALAGRAPPDADTDALATEARSIDLGEMMRTQARAAWIAPDGLHPDARAHDAWAEALARALPSPCR